MTIPKKTKYLIGLIVLLVIGLFVVKKITASYEQAENQKKYDQLLEEHHEDVLRIETGINIYSTIVSSIRSYIQNSPQFPKEEELQSYLKDLTKDISFKDSLIVSWVDTNQVFQYCVTPTKIDPFHLHGVSVKKLRPDFEIKMLNAVMKSDSIHLFQPINLVEGWAAFPFNFSARNNKGEILGYIAPVLNIKYLLNYAYQGGKDSLFTHRFVINDSIEITRDEVFDHTRSYSTVHDKEFYRNYNFPKESFIYSKVKFYNLSILVGTRYKNDEVPPSPMVKIIYLWFAVIILFSAITLFQLAKYNTLNSQLEIANKEIKDKNEQLEKSLSRIKLLIKEVHHRVKNNMQIISSLLNLQTNDQKDENVINALKISNSRIQSMALVHQKLYGTEDLIHVNLKDYITQLYEYIENSFDLNNLQITSKITIDKSIIFNVDTIGPIGLILNELITNSFKYAFNGNTSGEITISVIEISETYFCLIYTDTGSGIPDNVNINKSNSLGLELISILTEQLNGKMQYTKAPLSKFEIEFKTQN